MSEEIVSDKAHMSDRKPGRLSIAWRLSSPGLAAIAFFSIFINLLKLATPIYVLQLLDRVIASRSIDTLLMLSLVTLVAIVCGAMLEATRRKLFTHWGNWIERYFGPTLFAAGMLNDGRGSTDSSASLRDVGTLRSFASSQGLIAWLDLPWAPVFIGCVFLISSTLGYIVLVGSLLALIMGALNEFLSRESRNATRRAGEDARDWVSTAERERETVGSLNMVQSFAKRWSDGAITRQDENIRSRTLHINFSVGMRLVGQLVRISMLGVGIWLVINETLSLGAVIAANILGRIAYSLVRNALVRWREVVKARRAYGRIKRSLDHEKELVVSRSSITTTMPLTLQKVTYRYPGQPRSLLQKIDLAVNPGELLCVIGTSASGKSTFCRLISGVLVPSSGNVQLGEVDVYRLQHHSLDQEIGYLPQDITLFQGTVRENIANMEQGDIDQIIRAARLVGIHDAIVKLPKGYDTEIRDREPLLSAGQRKCIAVARAFYGNPQLVILDEPFPHLDYRTKRALVKGIKALVAEGTIVILTAQRLSAARMADKALLLSNGKNTFLASREEIAKHREARQGRSSRRRGRNRRKQSSESEPEEGAVDLDSGVIRPRFGHDG